MKALIDRGVVSFYHEQKRQHFVAENPESLLREARRQESEIQITTEQLEEALPEMKSMYDDASTKPKVRYFEGKKGVRAILDDLLDTLSSRKKKQYKLYSAVDIRGFLVDCYPEFTDKRIAADISVEVISTSPGGKLCGLDERKWVDGDEFLGHTYILVYADRVAYITQHTDTNVGVLIESQNIADTQVFLFNQLWNKLS